MTPIRTSATPSVHISSTKRVSDSFASRSATVPASASVRTLSTTPPTNDQCDTANERDEPGADVDARGRFVEAALDFVKRGDTQRQQAAEVQLRKDQQKTAGKRLHRLIVDGGWR